MIHCDEVEVQICYLRGCIIRAPAICFKEMTITHDIAESKICNFYVTVGIQQQILWLKVPVSHHVTVAVLNTWNYLF